MENEYQDPFLPQNVDHSNLQTETMSASQPQTPTSTTGNSMNVEPNQALKVAEIFHTAAYAFEKLGDLAMQLHMERSSLQSQTKWSGNDVDHLREALSRFAHELEQISSLVHARKITKISTDIRRKHLVPQQPVAPTTSTTKRSQSKLDPAIATIPSNITRNTQQYMPPHAPFNVVPQLSPTTKNYRIRTVRPPATAHERQCIIMQQADPLQGMPVLSQQIFSQPSAVPSQSTDIISHQSSPTSSPSTVDDSPPRLYPMI